MKPINVFLSIGLFALGSALAAEPLPEPAALELSSESRWRTVATQGPLPVALSAPEGQTRWDFRHLPAVDQFERTLELNGSHGEISTRSLSKRGAAPRAVQWDAVEVEHLAHWLAPTANATLVDPSGFRALWLDQADGQGATESWFVQTKRVGMGWLFLDAGPFEVILERALIHKKGAAGFAPATLMHRWIDPRRGVVARVWGAASADGQRRVRIDGIEVVEQAAPTRGPSLRIYSEDVDRPIYTRLAYGYDRGDGTTVNSLVPENVTTIGELAALPAWDFTSTTSANSVQEVASTSSAIDSGETCNFDQCGFTVPGAKLGREDKNFESSTDRDITLSVTERVDTATESTIYLRAGIRNEGEAGAFGTGESRICYSGAGLTEVPLWQFQQQDGTGFYMDNGDSWSSGVFQCENNIFNHVCPNSCGLFCPIYAAACGEFSGTNSSDVINEGPVTLPSGHTFQSLVVRNNSEFCVYLGSGCGLAVDSVRTVLYLWQVPKIGSVARLMSDQVALPDENSFTTLMETDIKYGLFPPLSLSVDSTADSTVSISWNPGSETARIDGYKVYWGPASGADAPYAFNSIDDPGQISISGTSATISGLAPGTDYFVTVTSLSDYLNPSSGVVRTFESLVYPMTTPGLPGDFPIEVVATTTNPSCAPTTEVLNLTVNKLPGGDTEVCWDPVADPCAEGYRVLGAATPEAFANFGELAAPGLTTCQTFASPPTYLLVRARGGAGDGPLGHYGQ